MFSIMLSLVLLAPVQDTKPVADVVLVVGRAAGGGYTYTCNGQKLDPSRVASGIELKLRPQDPGETPMFVLFEDGISLDKAFELGSLLEGHIGLKQVRYFAVSKETRTMLEINLRWDRWELSVDGRLRKKSR